MRKSERVPNLFTSISKLTPLWHSHLPYMDIGVTQQNNRINSRDNNIIWRHVCINIMNTDDSQVTWLGHVTDVILGANPVLLPFSLAPEGTKFSIYRGRKLENCHFERRLSSSDQMSNDPWSHSIHFPTTAVRIQCSTLWAVIVSWLLFSILIFLLIFIFLTFNLYFNFFFWCEPNISCNQAWSFIYKKSKTGAKS